VYKFVVPQVFHAPIVSTRKLLNGTAIRSARDLASVNTTKLPDDATVLITLDRADPASSRTGYRARCGSQQGFQPIVSAFSPISQTDRPRFPLTTPSRALVIRASLPFRMQYMTTYATLRSVISFFPLSTNAIAQITLAHGGVDDGRMKNEKNFLIDTEFIAYATRSGL
jgi:hypothetical protein